MCDKNPESYSSLLTIDSQIKKKPRPSSINVFSTSKSGVSKTKRKSRSKSPPKEDEFLDYDVPDRQYGDLYCKPCDAHMNSEQMWEAHIQGKRHLKAVKKGDTGDAKFDYLNEDPIMLQKINEDKRPIVGLQHIVEIQRLEQRPVYQCFLCSANVPTADQLLDHISGTKHRLAYLKEHDPARYELIHKSNLKKGHIEPVVAECIEKFELTLGRGKMLVKRERKDYKSPPRKNFKPEYDNSSRSSNQSKFNRENFDDARHGHHNDRDSRFDNLDASYSRPDDRIAYPSLKDKTKINERRADPRLSPNEVHYGAAYDNQYSKYPVEDRYGSSKPLFDERNSRPVVDDEYRRSFDDRYRSSKPPEFDNRYERQDFDSRLNRADFDRPVIDRGDYDSRYDRAEFDRYNSSSVEEKKYSYVSDVNENKYSDLREVVQHKPTPVPTVTSNTSVANDMDATLELFEKMGTITFLQAAIFKLSIIQVSTDRELKLLDKMSKSCTDLSLKIKTSRLPSILKEQFKESLIKSDVPTHEREYQEFVKFVDQFKADSQTVSPSYNSSASQLTSSSMYKHSNAATLDAARSSNVSAPETSMKSSYSWQHVDSNQPQTSTSYSTSTFIPGLTLTSDSTSAAQPNTSPFALLSRHANDLFGGFNTKSDSYQY